MSSVLGVARLGSVADLVGRTPLVRLASVERTVPGVEFYAKAEWLNPGGSVKDRPAARMIGEGLGSGALTRDRRILDATSGNTGIAYAMIGASLGYGVTLCVPANVTLERKRILGVYGAELIYTDPMDGSDGAIREARALYARQPERYFYPDQYNNEFNWRAHYETTGPEIFDQTGGRLTHFVAGLGTSGTFVGVGRFLREVKAGVVLASVQPESPLHGLEGLKHMESAIVPGIYDPALADIDVRMSTEEAYRVTRELAREEGLLVWISSGASLAGAVQVARRVDRRKTPFPVFVVVFSDGGDRYLSERFWDEADVNTVSGPSEADPRVRVHVMATPLTLTPAVDAAIRAHGRQVYPHECCGALIGRDADVLEACPLPNTTEEGPRRRFLVRPADYRLAEQRADERGLTLLGFYHSHPDHPARPSQYDLDHAWPSFAYIIVSVRDGQDHELTCWRLRHDRSAFEATPVAWTRKVASSE